MPPAEMPQSTPPATDASRAKPAFGPFIGIVVILLMVLIGAFYFWGKALNEKGKNPPPYIPEQEAVQS